MLSGKPHPAGQARGAVGAADPNESTARLTPSSTERSSAGVGGVASAGLIRVSSVVSRTSKLKTLFLFTILSFFREMCLFSDF